MRAYYEQRAPEYDDWWLGTGLFATRDRPGWEADVAALQTALAALPPARTLDVACGTGFLTQHLPGELTGLDQSAGMLDVAAARIPRATFVQGDALDPPFGPGAFERVHASHFYGHLLERRGGDAGGGDVEHRRALVEPGHLAGQVLREEAGPACDVERPRGRQRRQRGLQRGHVVLPAGPVAGREQARAEPPVVVLGRPLLVVVAHRRVHARQATQGGSPPPRAGAGACARRRSPPRSRRRPGWPGRRRRRRPAPRRP